MKTNWIDMFFGALMALASLIITVGVQTFTVWTNEDIFVVICLTISGTVLMFIISYCIEKTINWILGKISKSKKA